MNTMRSFLAAVLLVLASAATLRAHHGSPLFFDHSRVVTVEGTVRRVEWINPHILLFVEAKNDKGELETWVVQGTSLSNANRQAGLKDRLQPGMVVAVRAHPPRQTLALNDPLTVVPATPGDARHSPRIIEGGQVRLQDGELVRWGGGPRF
jgi:hypothetical protein